MQKVEGTQIASNYPIQTLTEILQNVMNPRERRDSFQVDVLNLQRWHLEN